jgi:hypothetical protein
MSSASVSIRALALSHRKRNYNMAKRRKETVREESTQDAPESTSAVVGAVTCCVNFGRTPSEDSAHSVEAAHCAAISPTSIVFNAITADGESVTNVKGCKFSYANGIASLSYPDELRGAVVKVVLIEEVK